MLKKVNLEVLIPVKKRPTIIKTILSLLEIDLIDLITIITPDELDISSFSLTYRHRIRVIKLDFEGYFIKSVYLNQGIKFSLGKWLLISDGDIIWNAKTIELLYETVKNNSHSMVCVADVKEDNPHNIILKRPRLTPIVKKINEQYFRLKLINDELNDKRPGCGLICAEKKTFLDLGGYNESLQGWGWEDQDLLIRGQILGYECLKKGNVIHLSHDDSLRNLSGKNPLETRNENIIKSCKRLQQGIIRGDLKVIEEEIKTSIIVEIDYPKDCN